MGGASEGIEGTMARARELNTVMSQEAIEALDSIGDRRLGGLGGQRRPAANEGEQQKRQHDRRCAEQSARNHLNSLLAKVRPEDTRG